MGQHLDKIFKPQAKKFSRTEAAIILYILLVMDDECTVEITFDKVHEKVNILPAGYHIALKRLLTRRIISRVDGDCYRLD